MKDKTLLFSITKKDFDIDTFCSGGPGGQHQNKTESGVRITHRASGAVGESRTFKSQSQNRKAALHRLVATKEFQAWWKLECARRIFGQKVVEKAVDEAMRPKNLKVEGKDENDRWVEIKENL